MMLLEPNRQRQLGNSSPRLTEGYTGWYANGNSKTYAIDNISIRAESIVGRTNVEVTEDVFNSVTGEIESRTYFKPIHRGAMLETYHDGTQEVVGTTFIDDFNWDRSAEYTITAGGWAYDTVNGCVWCNKSNKRMTLNGSSFGYGIYRIDALLDWTTPPSVGIFKIQLVIGDLKVSYGVDNTNWFYDIYDGSTWKASYNAGSPDAIKNSLHSFGVVNTESGVKVYEIINNNWILRKSIVGSFNRIGQVSIGMDQRHRCLHPTDRGRGEIWGGRICLQHFHY
jgi:hypothetical protein